VCQFHEGDISNNCQYRWQHRDLYERLVSRVSKASLHKQMIVTRAKHQHPSEHSTFSVGMKNALRRNFDEGISFDLEAGGEM